MFIMPTTKNLLYNFRQLFVLEKNSWIILVLTVISNGVLWYVWFKIAQYNRIILYYSTGVLILNIILSFAFSRKDVLVEYLFLGAALLVQILSLILLYHSIY